MTFEVRFEGVIRSVADGSVNEEIIPPSDLIKKFLNETMSYLSTGEHVRRADYSSDVGKGEFDLVISMEADEQLEAVELGSATIRAAFHAAGAYTPGWQVHWCSVTFEEAALLDA